MITVEQERVSNPERSCFYAEPKAVPVDVPGEGDGWYLVSVKIRPLEGGVPRLIPEKDLTNELFKEMARVSSATVERLKEKQDRMCPT